jgi:hypothetical protein
MNINYLKSLYKLLHPPSEEKEEEKEKEKEEASQ